MNNLREAPAPYHIIIAGQGFMLHEAQDPDVLDENGRPLSSLSWVQEQMAYSPGQPTPEAQPYLLEKDFEVPHGVQNFRSGAGFRVESEDADQDIKGYWGGEYIDKMGRYIGNGPAVTAVTPSTTDTTNGGNQFAEFTVGTTRTLLCAMGEYLLQRTADTASGWGTNAHDMGTSTKITSICPFRGTQTRDYLFIAYQNSSGTAQTYVVWDGATATTTFTADTNSNTAVDFIVFNEELWRLYQDSNNFWCVAKCFDGGTGATWSGGFKIADNTNTCKHFLLEDDQLQVRSEQGVINVTDGLDDQPQMVTGSEYKNQRQALNECRPISFGQWNIFQIASSWFTVDRSTGEIKEIGPATQSDQYTSAQGYVTANASYRQWTVYYAIWNPSNSTAYLWRWGEWEHIRTTFHPTDIREFLPSHFGSLWEQSSRINGMFVSEITGQPRLYFVDASGVISYFILSRAGANRLTDSSCTYNTSNSGVLYSIAHTSKIAHTDKVDLGYVVGTFNGSAGVRDVTVSYRLDAVSSYGGSANLENSGVFNTDPGSRNNFVTSVVSKWTDTKFTIRTTTSSTPMCMYGYELYTAIRAVFKWVFTGILRIGSEVTNQQGQPMYRFWRVEDAMNFLQTQASAGVVSITGPDGTTMDVLCTNIGKAKTIYRKDTETVEYLVPVQFMQHRQTTTAGQEQRLATLTEGQLAVYTEGRLAAF